MDLPLQVEVQAVQEAVSQLPQVVVTHLQLHHRKEIMVEALAPLAEQVVVEQVLLEQVLRQMLELAAVLEPHQTLQELQ
jgi:hypothetical protein